MSIIKQSLTVSPMRILIPAIAAGVAVVILGATLLQSERQFSHRGMTPDAETTQPIVFDDLSQRWVVTAQDAITLVNAGATLIDARGTFHPFDKTLEGAVATRWQDFSVSDMVRRGRLSADLTHLQLALRQLGVSNERPVVVFGDPVRGWGEEGRIVWMLRTLGHDQAVFVDGGIHALIESGFPTTRLPSAATSIQPGTFTIQWDTRWHIERDELRQQLQDSSIVLVDTREKREYDGQTPHGEQRGGHIPGAVHLYFKALLSSDGDLLPQEELMALLEAKGITPDKTIVVYCTGGVRSAWVASVLSTLGFSVKNYAGSTWEWAASPAQEYPLVVESTY